MPFRFVRAREKLGGDCRNGFVLGKDSEVIVETEIGGDSEEVRKRRWEEEVRVGGEEAMVVERGRV